MTRLFCILVAAAVMLAQPGLLLSIPIDTRAAEVLALVEKGKRDPDKRHLSKAELRFVLEMSNKSGSIHNRMAAAYALAFTDSEAGGKALEALRSDKDANVAGVAEFTRLYKQASRLKGQELLAVLSFHLGQSERPWTRTLLVIWLGDEFQRATIPMFLTALEKENDALVRAEMIFQIACYGKGDQLKTVRTLLNHEYVLYAESTAFFLNAVSRNPAKRRSGIPIQSFLQDVLGVKKGK